MTRPQKGPLPLFSQRFYLLLLVCAAALAVAWLWSALLTPLYRGQARCFLPAQGSTLSLSNEQDNLPAGPRLPVSSTETQDSLLGMLRSAELLEAVARRFPQRSIEEVQEAVEFDVDRFNLLVISALDREAQAAADLANAYLEALQERLRQDTLRDAASKRAAVEAAISAGEIELAAIERRRLDFLEARKLVDLDAEQAALARRIEELRGELADLEIQEQTAGEQVRELQARRDGRPEFSLSSRVAGANPRYELLLQEIAREEAQLAVLRVGHTADHPVVTRAEKRLESLRAQLAAEQQQVERSLTSTLDALRLDYERQLSDLELERAGIDDQRQIRLEQLEEALRQWQALPAAQGELQSIDLEASQARDALARLRERREELLLFEKRAPDYLEVLDRAQPAPRPYLPKLWLNLGAALLLGLAAGAVLIALTGRAQRLRELQPW